MYRVLPFVILLVACNGASKGSSGATGSSTQTKAVELSKKSTPRSVAPVGPGGEEKTLEPPQEFAVRVLKVLKSGDIKALASMVPPEGVRFSPDVYIDTGKDVLLRPEELIKAWEEDRVFVWGVQPGSGMPIKMGIREYFKRYVYERDYLRAPKVATNERLGRGNTKDNIKEVYPDAVFVEFHFPGSEKHAGMDWSSLRVVLKRYGEDWKVVAIVHDSWTP